MKKSVLAFAMAALLPVAAQAYHIEAQLGYGQLDVSLDQSTFPGSSLDSKGSLVGGFSFGHYFKSQSPLKVGLEIGIHTLPKAKYTVNTPPFFGSLEINQDIGVSYLVLADYQINPKYNIFAKGGAMSIHETINDEAVSNRDGTQAKAKGMLSIGAGYQLYKDTTLTAEVRHIFGSSMGGRNLSSDLYLASTSGLIGLRHTFA